MVCRYDGNCEVTRFTRLSCTACRLNKCFAIGMDPNYIRILDQSMIQSPYDRKDNKLMMPVYEILIAIDSINIIKIYILEIIDIILRFIKK